ncbi:MAG: family 16 glycosylhydrolase, partial [Bacteroidota bacterium]
VENFDGKFKNIISESWTDDDFFKGKIEKAEFISANFGNRDSLVKIDSSGIELKIPKSDLNKKNKTWGEIVFASAFKYGKVSALVKFCRLRNKGTRTPNGIVHNLWLYERDWEDAFPSRYNYYKYTDPKGLQPFEIDFEIWSSLEGYEPYDSVFFINYSIVDYFKDEKCSLRPQDSKHRNGFYMHRKNNRQVNIPSAPFPERFMDTYHLYQIEWKPTYVKFFIDGKLVGHITEREGAIPDKHLFFWVGSPIYQDGTFYDQRKIPFLEEDKFTHIKWIKIE